MREIVAWGAAGILLAAAAYLFWRPSPSQPGSSAQIRSSIVIPDSIYVHTYGSNSCGPPVLSPDGRAIVFTGVTPDGVARLYVRMLGESNARALPGTDGGKQPFWSPDGKMVGFFDDGKMKKVDLDGGSPTTIAVVPNPRGGAWGPDGTIVFTPDYQSGLFRVDASGNGTPAPVTSLDSSRQEGTHRWPVFLPDGKHVLYLARSTSESGDAEGDAVYVTALDGSDKKMLVQTSFNAAYAGGYLLFARSSSLFAQRFDLATLSVTGDPMKIEDGLVTDLSYNVAVFTAASNGMLLYQLGTAVAGAAPLVVNRAGKPVLAIEDHNEQDQPRFSPDGKQLAIYIYDIRSRRSNVWIYDLRTAGRRRLTTRSIGDFFPVWSPDGSTIYFRSGGASKGDIYETRTAAGGTAKFVASFADQEKVDDCSPDGKTLLLATNDPGGSRGDLWLLPLTGEKREPVPFQQTKFDEFDGRISRDGKWVAYVSNESGEEEIYLKRFDAPGSDPVKISSGGGETPLWGAGGTELIWINALEQVVSARLKFSGESVEATDLRVLFTLPPFATGYDVSPDGQTFAIARSIDMRQSAPLALVQHWEPATK